jgi:hypothetical protein
MARIVLEAFGASGFKGTPEEIERQWYEQVYRGRGDSMAQLTWRAVLIGSCRIAAVPDGRLRRRRTGLRFDVRCMTAEATPRAARTGFRHDLVSRPDIPT